MSKKAPSTTQLLVITGFALSCFGILLFLWITFGGPTPFKAKAYEVTIPFDEAAQLAQQSDVRISGVNVGKVQSIDRQPGKLAIAQIQIDPKYAPIPKDTRAILRTKTLLSETYVELTPGDRDGPELEDGGTLPEGNVARSVQIDEIFRTFNPRTRAAFQEWMQESALAIEGQGEGLSAAFGELDTTFTEFEKLFRVLDTQKVAVRQLFSNSAVALDAFRGRNGELAELVQSSNEVFQTAAQRDRDLEALFRAFPTFQDESRLTLERLRAFAENTDPLMRQLVPAAEELSPTLIAFENLAPEAQGFFEGFGPVIDRATTGFPALRKLFRDSFPPLLRAVDPFARNLNPLLTGLDLYRREITAAMANVAAATNAVHQSTTGEQLNYLRALGPFIPENYAYSGTRYAINRSNAYSQPGMYEKLASGLPSFDTRGCSGISTSLNPETPKIPAFKGRVEYHTGAPGRTEAEQIQLNEREAASFFERIKHYAYRDQESTAALGAPACTQQAPFEPIYGSGGPTMYQQTFEQGK